MNIINVGDIMKKEILLLNNGDRISFSDKYMVLELVSPRHVVSTSPLNGGYGESISSIFNYDETPEGGGWCQMKAETYAEHLKIVAETIGLNPVVTTGLSTTVNIENTVIVNALYHGHEINVICTAGLDINASRAADPSGYDELLIKPDMHKGTINIICHCDLNIPSGSLTRMLITLTEAKTAAIQELMVGSCYSEGLATGSGTDGVIVISNPSSVTEVTNVGAHAVLGEIIGKLTKKAVKKALFQQTGLDSLKQLDVYQRLKRFDVDEMLLLLSEDLCKNEMNVIYVSTIVHLLDQMSWGLIRPEAVIKASQNMLNLVFEIKESDCSNASKVKDYVLRGLIQFLIDSEEINKEKE